MIYILLVIAMLLVGLIGCNDYDQTTYNTEYQSDIDILNQYIESEEAEEAPETFELRLEAKFTQPTEAVYDYEIHNLITTKQNYFFVIAVDRNTYNKYQPLELITSEDLSCLPISNAEPFTNFTVTLGTRPQKPVN